MVDSSKNSAPEKRKDKGSFRAATWIWLLFMLVIVITPFIYYFWRQKKMTEYEVQRNDTYYAVFLANGEIYFGHMMYEYTDTVNLSEVYYLRMVPVDSEDSSKGSMYQLVKRGKELHGPETLMQINRDHVLYWEELSDDSKVLAAIKDYTANPNPSVSPEEVEQMTPETEESEDTDTTDEVSFDELIEEAGEEGLIE